MSIYANTELQIGRCGRHYYNFIYTSGPLHTFMQNHLNPIPSLSLRTLVNYSLMTLYDTKHH